MRGERDCRHTRLCDPERDHGSDETGLDRIAAPFIHAVGGSWVCPKADIAAGNFEKITTLCKQARAAIQEVRK